MKKLLITGGTGSFGNALVKRLLTGTSEIGEIRILSRDELKQEQMKERLNDSRLQFYLGDVRQRSTLEHPMKDVDYVFHAAALKQVPSCEKQPLEAMYTNIIGSANVFDIAVRSGVSKVVALSTDKAVMPVNTMGISKAFMEKLVQEYAMRQAATAFCCTRYGNVMGSRGSVIPKFWDTMRSGHPVPITSLQMTRFMMNLDDAVDLVLQALQTGVNGHTYVLKSSAATVEDIYMALASMLPDAPVYHIQGVRPGEKMHETLVTEAERGRADEDEKYINIPPEVNSVASVYKDAFTSDTTTRLSVAELSSLIQQAKIL